MVAPRRDAGKGLPGRAATPQHPTDGARAAAFKRAEVAASAGLAAELPWATAQTRLVPGVIVQLGQAVAHAEEKRQDLYRLTSSSSSHKESINNIADRLTRFR